MGSFHSGEHTALCDGVHLYNKTGNQVAKAIISASTVQANHTSGPFTVESEMRKQPRGLLPKKMSIEQAIA